MSAAALAWALDQRRPLSTAERLLLVILADYARPDGAAAFVSLSSLSERSGMCREEVAWHLGRLEVSGLIRPCQAPLLEPLLGRIPQGYTLALDGARDAAPESNDAQPPRRSPPNLIVLPGGHL